MQNYVTSLCDAAWIVSLGGLFSRGWCHSVFCHFSLLRCCSANWPLMCDHSSVLHITEISFMHWQNHCAPLNNIYPWAKLHSYVLNECCWKGMKWRFNRMIRFKDFTFSKVSWMHNLDERWFCISMEFCASVSLISYLYNFTGRQPYGLTRSVRGVKNSESFQK